jgi:hypothetical protein
MGRSWISKNIGAGIRIGRSFSDWQLPRTRRFELRSRLQTAAKARGQPITKEEADYCIDRALETGNLDRNGTLHLNIEGATPEDVIERTIVAAAAWGETLSHSAVEQMVKVKHRNWGLVTSWLAVAIVAIGLFLLLVACIASPASAGCASCLPPFTMHRFWDYPGDQINPRDVYRYGEPENGGYRYGGRGADGKYMNNTVYRD